MIESLRASHCVNPDTRSMSISRCHRKLVMHFPLPYKGSMPNLPRASRSQGTNARTQHAWSRRTWRERRDNGPSAFRMAHARPRRGAAHPGPLPRSPSPNVSGALIGLEACGEGTAPCPIGHDRSGRREIFFPLARARVQVATHTAAGSWRWAQRLVHATCQPPDYLLRIACFECNSAR